MKIKINDIEYHIGKVNYKNYPILLKLQKTFRKVDSALINKLGIATIKENYDKIKPLNETDTFIFLEKNVKEKLQYVLKNENEVSTNHCCLYKKNMVTSLYLCIKYMNKVNTLLPNSNCECDYEHDYIILCNNALRSIKSIIVLLSVGDDVHAYALLRGYLEMVAKLLYLDTYDVKNNFLKYNRYNSYIQKAKMTHDDSEFPDDLRALLKKKNVKYNSQKIENILLYEWMDADVKIHNAKDLINFAFDNDENMLMLHHISSEFVHEDYIATYYDYIVCRSMIIEYLPDFTEEITSRLDDCFNRLKAL